MLARGMPIEQVFQSTPPRGKRRGEWRIWNEEICFNPRLHEGGDGDQPRGGRAVRGFKPRLHEGGDIRIFGKRIFKSVSIHASAREATALITKIHLKHHISF